MENADDLIRDAQKLENQKNYARAIELFGKAVSIDHRRLDAHSGLVRCAENAPDPYYKAMARSALDAGVARQANVDASRSDLIKEFDLAVRAEQEVLEGQLDKVKKRVQAARADAALWLAKDEVKLIAGARVLKSYGFGVAKLNIQSGNADLVVESVKKGTSTKD